MIILIITTGCSPNSPPTMQLLYGDDIYIVPGRPYEVVHTGILGETSTQEVCWAEPLEAVQIVAIDSKPSAIRVVFSNEPISAVIRVESNNNTEVIPIATGSFCVDSDANYTITGEWKIGRYIYCMEFASISVS